ERIRNVPNEQISLKDGLAVVDAGEVRLVAHQASQIQDFRVARVRAHAEIVDRVEVAVALVPNVAAEHEAVGAGAAHQHIDAAAAFKDVVAAAAFERVVAAAAPE